MTKPNILLVVWDACRLDAAREYAPNLVALAEENLWFENAVAPAGTSLPSHVSTVTGTYPHEHGTYRQSHDIDSVPLVADLGEAGYHTVGVSANGFASPKYGFDDPFDEFHNTQGLLVSSDGLDVHGYARKVRERSEDGFSIDDVDRLDLLSEILRHEHSIKSALNVAAVGLSEMTGSYPFLQRIPHPRFNQYNEFCYSPEHNTQRIVDALERDATRDGPSFVFTNYMDAHHPYAPPERFQRECCDRTFSYRELDELSRLTHPWNYVDRVASEGSLPEETVETIRGLYAGEVRRADEHLGRLLDVLERQGLREDTLVVVTADHGENLAETNRMGEDRIGHVCSASDHHLRVPLVVAHPDIDGRSVEEYVSTKDLSPLLTDGLETLLESSGTDLGPLAPENGIVSSQVPATDNEALVEKYPALEGVLGRHIVASYAPDWKVVLTSTGEEYAWENGDERDLSAAPDDLVATCRDQLAGLVETSTDDRELTDAEVSHLEALGYI